MPSVWPFLRHIPIQLKITYCCALLCPFHRLLCLDIVTVSRNAPWKWITEYATTAPEIQVCQWV